MHFTDFTEFMSFLKAFLKNAKKRQKMFGGLRPGPQPDTSRTPAGPQPGLSRTPASRHLTRKTNSFICRFAPEGALPSEKSCLRPWQFLQLWQWIHFRTEEATRWYKPAAVLSWWKRYAEYARQDKGTVCGQDTWRYQHPARLLQEMGGRGTQCPPPCSTSECE